MCYFCIHSFKVWVIFPLYLHVLSILISFLLLLKPLLLCVCACVCFLLSLRSVSCFFFMSFIFIFPLCSALYFSHLSFYVWVFCSCVFEMFLPLCLASLSPCVQGIMDVCFPFFLPPKQLLFGQRSKPNIILRHKIFQENSSKILYCYVGIK